LRSLVTTVHTLISVAQNTAVAMETVGTNWINCHLQRPPNDNTAINHEQMEFCLA